MAQKYILIGVITVVIVVAIFFMIKNVNHRNKHRPFLVKGFKDATVYQKLPGDIITKSEVGYEFTFQTWIFVKDWGHNFSRPKHVFHVGDENGNSVCPGLWLYPKNNNLMVRIDTYDRVSNTDLTEEGDTCQNWSSQFPHKHKYTPDKYSSEGIGDHNYCRDPDKSGNTWCYTNNIRKRRGKCSVKDWREPSKMNPSNSDADMNGECDIVNIPVQRWVHIAMVLHNRTMDVYLNGKLSRSCTLDSLPKFNNGDVHINKDEGFHGEICDLMYISRAISPSEVMSYYLSGRNPLDIMGLLAAQLQKHKPTMPKVKLNVKVDIDTSGE